VTCAEIIDFLMAYVDGDLPAEQQAIFAHHLEICPACQNYLDSYRQTLLLSKQACDEVALPQNCAPIPADLVKAIIAARRNNAN
jgi:anti-sigma factor RsiW